MYIVSLKYSKFCKIVRIYLKIYIELHYSLLGRATCNLRNECFKSKTNELCRASARQLNPGGIIGLCLACNSPLRACVHTKNHLLDKTFSFLNLQYKKIIIDCILYFKKTFKFLPTNCGMFYIPKSNSFTQVSIKAVAFKLIV